MTATLLTVVAMALTVIVAAVTIGTFTGDEVTVGGVAASSVTYSLDNTTFTTTLHPDNASSSWYTRLEIGAGSYNGPVTITWDLQQKTGPSTWEAVPGASTATNATLTGNAESIYASADGGSASNYDWSIDVAVPGSYRVVALVESA